LYPGLLCALLFGALFGLILGDPLALPALVGLLRTRDTVVLLAALLCAAIASTLLPWPLNPLGTTQGWMWAWAALELAFLLPLLPGLLNGAPPLVRTALREAQIGVAARALFWLALGTLYAAGGEWGLAALPARLVATLTALLAYPAAIAWGPFGGGQELVQSSDGLSTEQRALTRCVNQVRAAVLLVAGLLAILPIARAPVWLALAMLLVAFGASLLVLRQLDGLFPRMTIQAIMRYCWQQLLPLGIVAVALAALLG
jgi:hypothetical protein